MQSDTNQKYILVTGGELFNKGAQAMSFITVDQMARRYPEYRVILFSGADARREENEKKNYKFEIMPFPGLGETLSLCTGLLKRRYLNRENGKYFEKYLSIFKNAVALLDISGFGLGSKWSKSSNFGYLRRIKLAKRFNIPIYLMPQSFGPFDFSGIKSLKMHAAIKRTLSKANLIMAREKEGLQLLSEKYKLKNVIKTPDLVLQNKSIDVTNVYNTPPVLREFNIPKGSVAIIPNSKNNKFGNEEDNMLLYKDCILTLLDNNKHIYLMYHAVEDLRICEKIKSSYFINNDNVHLISEELNCVEFDNIVSKLDFIIGSRYHSIVHAYRKGVPAIILGWAIKYRELADSFGQIEYCFDSSNIISYKNIFLQKINQMCENFEKESSTISLGVEEIQKENVYDLIQIKY